MSGQYYVTGPLVPLGILKIADKEFRWHACRKEPHHRLINYLNALLAYIVIDILLKVKPLLKVYQY